MRAADQRLAHAGGQEGRADQEEQRVDRQGGVEHAGQHHAQDALKGALDREIGVGLLQLVLLHDMGQQRAGRGIEDPADDIPDDPQREQDRDVRVRRREQEHQRRGQDDRPALAEVAQVHDLRLAEAVAQHAAHRREQQHRRAAQGQVQALEEGVVVADLQDIEADGEAVQQRAQLRHQRAEKHQPVVPVAEHVFRFHIDFHLTHL